VIGPPIEEALQAAGQRDEDGVAQHAHVDGELRPEVAHLQQERLAAQARHDPGRQRLEDRRGRAHDQVDRPGPHPAQTDVAAKTRKARMRQRKLR
jgi:hypothetical protein